MLGEEARYLDEQGALPENTRNNRNPATKSVVCSVTHLEREEDTPDFPCSPKKTNAEHTRHSRARPNQLSRLRGMQQRGGSHPGRWHRDRLCACAVRSPSCCDTCSCSMPSLFPVSFSLTCFFYLLLKLTRVVLLSLVPPVAAVPCSTGKASCSPPSVCSARASSPRTR